MLDIDTAIKHCLEVAEKNDGEAEVYDLLAKNHNNQYEKLTASRFYTDCAECAADHRQLAEWLTELKELRKLTAINPIIAGYNEVYEKLIKGDIEESNDKDLLKTAVETLENVMPKYRRLSEGNQKQEEQIAEYKRLLKSATNVLNRLIACDEDYCSECIKQRQNCDYDDRFKWRYADEALALIGEEGENDA